MEIMETAGLALQDTWVHGTCFGCGPANPIGLQIKSYWSEDESTVVAIFHPKPEHNAGVENVMYGGLIASLVTVIVCGQRLRLRFGKKEDMLVLRRRFGT